MFSHLFYFLFRKKRIDLKFLDRSDLMLIENTPRAAVEHAELN